MLTHFFVSRSVFILCLTLVFSLPRYGQTFPMAEWENLDADTGERLAQVEIQPGNSWKEPLSEMTLLWIPGGCFKMGSPPSVEGRDADEGPVHTTCLSGFWMGEREITQYQWQHVMQRNPAQFRKEGLFPVENISRLEVESFTARLNIHYQGRVVFNVPTEAQWEYACRNAGQNIPYPGYDQIDQLAWYQSNSTSSTQESGSRKANRLGLLDMSGNVWEWVQDTYDKTAYSQQAKMGTTQNPVQKGVVPFSVIRGGGWNEASNTLRCANRGFERVSNKRSNLGARLVAAIDVVREAEETEQRTQGMPF